METILGFIIAVAGAGLWFTMKKAAADNFVATFGPTVSNVFDIIDPIAGDIFGDKYEGTSVQEVIELAVLRVSDGDLDQQDVTAVASYIVKKFNPALASSKVLNPKTQKGAATVELAESLKQLADGTNFLELASIARKATAIL